MKRLLKQSILVLFSAIFVVTLVSVHAEAATAADRAKAIYNRHILKYNIANYKIVDIDKNKVPELLVLNWQKGKSYVYTYDKKTKKMKTLASLTMGRNHGVYYTTSKHRFIIYYGSTGDCIYRVYQLKGTKAKKIATYTGKRNYNTNKWTYKQNNKKISHSKWIKSLNQYTKKCKLLPGSM